MLQKNKNRKIILNFRGKKLKKGFPITRILTKNDIKNQKSNTNDGKFRFFDRDTNLNVIKNI